MMKSSRHYLATTAAAMLAGLAALGGIGDTAQSRDTAQSIRASDGRAVRVADMTGTAQQLHRASVDKFVRQASRSFGGGMPRPAGTGWPVATDRRRARKARNVKRNRRAHK